MYCLELLTSSSFRCLGQITCSILWDVKYYTCYAQVFSLPQESNPFHFDKFLCLKVAQIIELILEVKNLISSKFQVSSLLSSVQFF